MTPARYRDGARKIAPIAVAAFAFAVSFGVLARASGIYSLEAIVMSATTFAGSAQFAVASILGAAGGVVSAIVAATLLNARYAPISVSVAPVLVGGPVRRLLESQLIVDESWAMSRRADGRYDRKLLVGGRARPLRVLGRRHRDRGDRAGMPSATRPVSASTPPSPPSSSPSSCRRCGPRRALAAARPRRHDRARPPPGHPGRRPDRRGRGGVPDGLETTVSDAWIAVVAVGTATVALKSVGPVLLGGRPLPDHLTGVVALLAPALLAALVVTQVAGGDEEIVLDARLVGLGAAVVAILLRAPLLAVVVAAAASTAIVRLL